MKILYVIPYFVPAWDYGGPLQVAYGLSRELVRRGHEVTVYTTDTLSANNRVTEREEIIDKITVKRFKNLSNTFAYRHNIFLSLGMFLSMREVKGFDVIHMHEYRTLQNALIHHYAKIYGIPYVLQAHGSLLRRITKQRLKKLYDGLWGYKLLRDASKVIALSQTEAEQYKSMGVNQNKIEIVPNGIDLSLYNHLPARGEFRRKYFIGNGEKLILFLGRIHIIKGLDLLVEAWDCLRRESPNAKLVIVGSDDGYLPQLKQLIAKLQSGREIVLTGPLYGRDKLEAYVDADVYVLPSTSEGFPVSVLESCACGTPIIVSDQCGIADIVDNQVGLVVPPNKNQLSAAILHMLSDQKMRQQFGERGKSLVRERFNWERIAEQVEDMYRGCIETGTVDGKAP